MIDYSYTKMKSIQRGKKNRVKNAESRSGEVVTRKIGEDKVSPPPPTTKQISKQRRYLS